MFKTLTLGTLLTSMWQSPVIALLLMVALVFLIDLLNRYWEPRKITCVPVDWDSWVYNDLSTLARLHNIKSTSRKRKAYIYLIKYIDLDIVIKLSTRSTAVIDHGEFTYKNMEKI